MMGSELRWVHLLQVKEGLFSGQNPRETKWPQLRAQSEKIFGALLNIHEGIIAPELSAPLKVHNTLYWTVICSYDILWLSAGPPASFLLSPTGLACPRCSWLCTKEEGKPCRHLGRVQTWWDKQTSWLTEVWVFHSSAQWAHLSHGDFLCSPTFCAYKSQVSMLEGTFKM